MKDKKNVLIVAGSLIALVVAGLVIFMSLDNGDTNVGAQEQARELVKSSDPGAHIPEAEYKKHMAGAMGFGAGKGHAKGATSYSADSSGAPPKP
jgi:hypothetical protein